MAQVKIGPEFFAKARNDYSEWKWALIREFMQNSIDCGSSRIAVDVAHVAGGKTQLTVTNNGKPMTEEILVNKLLSLGSSGKDFAAGAVGGFGKAKELLYFCHRSYVIRSGSCVVEGSGAEYTLTEAKKPVKGTESTVVMEGDYVKELLNAAKLFCSLCGVNCTFVINGAEQETKLRKGAYRRDLNCGKVYTNRQLSNVMVVRIGGIPMFMSHTKFDGCVVLELDGTSSKSLTSNRDGLRYEARCEAEGFLSDLTVNKRKALKQPVIEYFRYDGAKIVCAGMAKQEAAHAAPAVNPDEAGPAIDATALAASGKYGTQLITEHDRMKARTLANAFIVKNETGRTVPAAYRPDSEDFCKYAYRMATIWARLMTVMHKIFEHNDEFTIGFVFSEDCLAQYEATKENGKVYFLNPVKIEDGRWTKRYEYSIGYGREDLNQIAISALHEFVHGLGYSDHDEDYAAKLTDMAGKLLGHTKELLWCYRGK